MSVDIKKVAKEANVSISTVSRTLNNSGYVSEKTRKRVVAVVSRLKYKKNMIATSLRSKKSNFIGLIVPDIANEFYATLARAVEVVLQKNDFSLFLCSTDWDEEKRRFYMEALINNHVTGIISSFSIPKVEESSLGDIPVVLADRSNDYLLKNAISIESDNYGGGLIAGNMLIARGARKIAFLRDRRSIRQMRQREAGILEALKQNGLSKKDYRIIPADYDPENAARAIKDIFFKFKFDGLFCASDVMAVGAMRGLIDLGIRIPADVQVIGFDGISLGKYLVPSLSTISQDIEKMGALAATKILAMINGAPSGEEITLQVDFIKRESTL